MRSLIAILLLCATATAHEVPSSVLMPNGETMYVTGHQCSDNSVQSGDWIDPATWADGTVPTLSDNVCIHHGHTVRMHGEMEARNIVCEGNVEWFNTAHLTVSTITGLHHAKWFAGIEACNVRFTIDFFSQPFEAADTGQMGNGLIWMGHDSIAIYGAVDGPVWEKNGDDYSVHPERCGVVFRHDAGDIKPHVMVMHGSGVFRGVHFDGLGRTDKSKLLSSTNPAGRYALHFHRGGEQMVSVVEDCVSTGSPGWGIVNHSSNVIATGCAVADFYGAGFICEAANEVGSWRDCLAISSRSLELPAPYLRQLANDRWHSGEGFVGTAKVEVLDCVAADVNIGFSWGNKGLLELIAGQWVSAAYSDGDSLNMPQVPQRGMQVHGYSLFGFSVWSVSQKHKYDNSTYADFSDFAITGGGPKSTAIEQSYSGNCRFRDGVVSGANVAVAFVNQSAFQEYVHLNVSNVSKGFSSRDTNMGWVTWLDSEIHATNTAMPMQASRHPHANRVWVIENTVLDAPVPYKMLYEPDQSKWDALYINNPAGPVVNEVWIDGEQIPYPWQEQ